MDALARVHRRIATSHRWLNTTSGCSRNYTVDPCSRLLVPRFMCTDHSQGIDVEGSHSPEIFPLPEGIDGSRPGIYELLGTEGTGEEGNGLRVVLGVHGPREYWSGAGGIETAQGGMFAVVETAGRQYKVVAGDTLYTNRQPGEVNGPVVFDKIVLIGTLLWSAFGRPYIPNACVRATVEAQTLTRKIYVIKFKKRKGYRRKIGHRQPITRYLINQVEYSLPSADLIVPHEVKLDPLLPISPTFRPVL